MSRYSSDFLTLESEEDLFESRHPNFFAHFVRSNTCRNMSPYYSAFLTPERAARTCLKVFMVRSER